MSKQKKPQGEPNATWPERIYLQHGNYEIPPYSECRDITWAEENIHGNDIEYIRNDPASVRRLAERITESIFVNGQGERASRVALKTKEGLAADAPRDLGGWSKAAFTDRVYKALTEREEKA